MEWNPHVLRRCLDSQELAVIVSLFSVGTLIWYHIIGYKWYKSASRSSAKAKKVWNLLLFIFIFCAWAGYGAVVISLWLPKTSIYIRITFLILQNIACPIFLHYAWKFDFENYGKQQSIGQKMLETSFDSMSDQEIAALARRLVQVGLERQKGE